MKNVSRLPRIEEQSNESLEQIERSSVWDTLSSEKPTGDLQSNPESLFQPNDGLDREKYTELCKRLTTDFENNFYRIIRDLLCKKNSNSLDKNKRNLNNYAPRTDFEFVADMKHQEEMIREFCETGAVTEKTLGDAHVRLAKAICDSRFANEMNCGDYFLRQERAEYLAGRLDFTEGSPMDELMLQSLWVLDPSFEKSDEVRRLVTDRDYLYKVYGKKIERELLSQSRSGSEKSLQIKDPGQYERWLSKELNKNIRCAVLSAGELLKDPFLRERHIESLRRSGQKQPPVVEKIWRLDGTDFYNDRGFIKYLNQIRDDNADIFRNVSYAEVEQRVMGVIEKIPDKTIRKVLRVYKRDLHQGDLKLIRSLSPILGLSQNQPKILYRESRDGNKATYYEVEEDGIEENTIVYHEDKEQSFLQKALWVFYPTPLIDESINRVESIGHEMWHAHQNFGDNVDPELREQYSRNARYYIKPQYDVWSYSEQLLELEAGMFGKALMSKAEKMYNKKEQ